LISAATGLEHTPETLRQVGQRVLDTERLINADFGLSRADDTLPKRYFDEPMPGRKSRGHRIERDKFQQMLDDYYQERSWDSNGKVPKSRQTQIDQLIALL